MFKNVLIFLCFPMVLHAQDVQHIAQLFDSLKTHPATQGDEIRIEQALAGKTMAYSKLYPNINLFGRYDYASSATAMLPLPLNELFAYKADPTKAQPFSENIYRVGATISMPIFVASIFPMAAKAKMMARSAKDLKNINLLKNEAVIVGANANLLYMQALDSALTKKRNSLLKTKEFVVIKTNNGRAPESALLNINNGISQIDIMKNDLALQRDEVVAVIQSLTGVALNSPVTMEQVGTYKDGNIKALDPLREKAEADRLGYRAEKEKLLPSLVLQGSYSNNTAKSYNNNQRVNNDYTAVGIVLRIPLFAKDQYAQIKKSRLDYEASKNDLDRMSLELSSQASQLQSSLLLLDNSILLYKTSIKDKEQLLGIAKVSYQSDRLSMEDYLKYEDDLVLEQSKLFKAQAQKWQTLMKLNVIYGNNIEEVVK
ncbi:MAG TPA: TolC family protein [Williamwhitmania sp.]|nr:TolC family protein [Williamwhitmania sp.]